MKNSTAGIVLCLFLFGSVGCNPKISTSISNSYATLDYRESIVVYQLDEVVPNNYEVLGEVKIGDTGFSTKCGYELVIDKAKLEARKVGGNALKITEHKLPNPLGSSCHRIKANILKINKADNAHLIEREVDVEKPINETVLSDKYALLHVYRGSGKGVLVNYDLHLGDDVLCRVSHKRKETVLITMEGLNTIWAKTEAKEELPINIEFGKEYYLRCGISFGIMVGRPDLEFVSEEVWANESKALKENSDLLNNDVLVLKDGRQFKCEVNSEDNEKVVFTLIKNNKKIKTSYSRDKVSFIKYAKYNKNEKNK